MLEDFVTAGQLLEAATRKGASAQARRRPKVLTSGGEPTHTSVGASNSADSRSPSTHTDGSIAISSSGRAGRESPHASCENSATDEQSDCHAKECDSLNAYLLAEIKKDLMWHTIEASGAV